jgi:hypothetical protein
MILMTGLAMNSLVGQVFGYLTVVSFNERRGSAYYWNCACKCGAARVVRATNLKNGNSKSCGCFHKEVVSKSSYRHGLSGIPEYNVWVTMHCIQVCAEWDDFGKFFAHVGKRPTSKHSIDRIENDRPYVPGNVKWSTKIEQANNTSRNKRHGD